MEEHPKVAGTMAELATDAARAQKTQAGYSPFYSSATRTGIARKKHASVL